MRFQFRNHWLRGGIALALIAAPAVGEADAETRPAPADVSEVAATPGEADRWDLQARLAERLESKRDAPSDTEELSPLEDSSTPDAPLEASFAPPQDGNVSLLDDRDARQQRINLHHTESRTASLLPPEQTEQLYRMLGDGLRWWGQHEPARAAYAKAIGSGPGEIATWRALGEMRVRTGDLDGAEAAFLAALDRSYARSTPAQGAAIHRDLGALYLLTGRVGEAGFALERAKRHDPDSLRTTQLLARARHAFAPSHELAPPGPVALWPENAADRERAGWESALLRARAAMPSAAQHWLHTLYTAATGENTRWAFAAAIALCLIAWIFARRTGGRGDLSVTIAYPVELAGRFSVRIATQHGRWKRLPRSARSSMEKETRTSTKTERYGVSRETQFQGLRAGVYYVTVEGVLQDPDSGEILTDPFEEQPIQVAANETIYIDFDVAPRESLVDVRVSWDKRPANDAGVAARGFPQSLRYARDGATRLRLPKGQHTIVVGSGDRVAECEVDLDSFRAASVDIDLGASENLIFKGCPPAVEPYLHGDLSAASRALDRDGHGALANLLLARLHREQGQLERAASHFELAGRPIEAAELHAELCNHAEAARLFQAGGALARAGEMLREAGQLLQAGSCFEQASNYESAILCFRDAGDTSRWIDAVERSGDVFGAAIVAVEQGDRGRTIRLLQQIPPDHSSYPEASELLVEAYLQEGHRDLAIRKLEERIGAAEPGQSPLDLHFQLGELLEEEGELAQALTVFSDLRELEPTYPEIAPRIEALRKKLSKRDLAGGAGSAGEATAFLAKSRYEILGELGRGGMGVVVEARDTRLQRIVALKRLPDNLSDHPKAIQLFLREAQSAARLNHPNIVTVYDTDQEDGVFFITMERLEGLPISKILKQRGRVHPRNVAQLGLQIAAGLEYAHGQGIVHRDIKSANLFFTKDKVVKIMDFGLAKMMEEVRRGTTVVGGTPYYMAPEQATGDTVDQRADIYALGVTFYELLTGSVPFREGDVTYHHRHTAVPDPRTRCANIPAPMAALVLRMLEKSPEDRIPSAAEVTRHLTPLADRS